MIKMTNRSQPINPHHTKPENYDRLLVTDPEHQALGKELRARLKETTKAVLRLSGNEKLQQHNTVRFAWLRQNMYIIRPPLLRGLC